MAVKTAQYVFNGQTYDLTFDASTGEYKAAVPRLANPVTHKMVINMGAL